MNSLVATQCCSVTFLRPSGMDMMLAPNSPRRVASWPRHGGGASVQARLLDFPCGVVGNVHCKIAPRTCQRGHRVARKGFTAFDAFILASSSSDDVSAAIHVRLGFVQITRVKGRENLVTIGVGQHAGTINV